MRREVSATRRVYTRSEQRRGVSPGISGAEAGALSSQYPLRGFAGGERRARTRRLRASSTKRVLLNSKRNNTGKVSSFLRAIPSKTELRLPTSSPYRRNFKVVPIRFPYTRVLGRRSSNQTDPAIRKLRRARDRLKLITQAWIFLSYETLVITFLLVIIAVSSK